MSRIPAALRCCEQAAIADDHLETSVAKPIAYEGPVHTSGVCYECVWISDSLPDGVS